MLGMTLVEISDTEKPVHINLFHTLEVKGVMLLVVVWSNDDGVEETALKEGTWL